MRANAGVSESANSMGILIDANQYLKSCLLLLRQCHMLHYADIFAEQLMRT